MFVATGVTDGSYLRGVRFTSGGATTNSIVMRSASGTVREISANHHFSKNLTTVGKKEKASLDAFLFLLSKAICLVLLSLNYSNPHLKESETLFCDFIGFLLEPASADIRLR